MGQGHGSRPRSKVWHAAVDIRGSALPSAAKSNNHYQPKVIVCVSVISRRLRVYIIITTIGGTCVVGFVHGSPSSEASRRGSGVNKQMDLVFYLFLTGVRVVPEPSDTSTTIEGPTATSF